MTPEPSTTPTKLCPTCGSRNLPDAARCVVCNTDLSSNAQPSKAAERAVQGSRMPEITLSLPIALLLFAVLVGLGAGLLFVLLRTTGQTPEVIPPTETPTPTYTATATLTLTPAPPTATFTPEPSPTPLTYLVVANDNCISIAAAFKVSIQSIVLANNLPADCGTLFEGQRLLIPQPTPTVTPQPSTTLSAAEATEQACEKVSYVVQANDTLSGIASFYGIPMSVIRTYNGLTSDVVISGVTLVIPLCEREPTPGPSPTATLPPPYSAPNLLLPPDGASYTAGTDTISLQWAAVGNLNENEYYQVTVVDVTEGQNRTLTDVVRDTKFIVPRSFRSSDSVPHAYRWTVTTVRQAGSDASGNIIYESAGATSAARIFVWSTGAAPAATPQP